jgi:hypothetical protein
MFYEERYAEGKSPSRSPRRFPGFELTDAINKRDRTSAFQQRRSRTVQIFELFENIRERRLGSVDEFGLVLSTGSL